MNDRFESDAERREALAAIMQRAENAYFQPKRGTAPTPPRPVATLTALRCAYCNCTRGPFADDHVVPRSRGGPDEPRNLVKACRSCNCSKGDRMPSEWLKVVPPLVAAIELRVSESIAVKIRRKRDGKRKQVAQAPERKWEQNCDFCGGPISSLGNAFIEFYDTEKAPYRQPTWAGFLPNGTRQERGQLRYPGSGELLTQDGSWSGWRTGAVLSHARCGPDILYPVELKSLTTRQELAAWHNHIADKTWSSTGHHMNLDDAAAYARLLRMRGAL